MSHDRTYRRLISSTRWQHLARQTKADSLFTCQRCGIVTHRLAVHHVKPLESCRTPQEMETLCFDPSNLQVLCYQCHKEIHAIMGTRGRNAHKQSVTEYLNRIHASPIDTDIIPDDPSP